MQCAALMNGSHPNVAENQARRHRRRNLRRESRTVGYARVITFSKKSQAEGH